MAASKTTRSGHPREPKVCRSELLWFALGAIGTAMKELGRDIAVGLPESTRPCCCGQHRASAFDFDQVLETASGSVFNGTNVEATLLNLTMWRPGGWDDKASLPARLRQLADELEESGRHMEYEERVYEKWHQSRAASGRRLAAK